MVKARASSNSLRRARMRAIATLSLVAALLVAMTFAHAQRGLASSSSSVSIRTPDFDASVKWYRDTLGFRLITTQSATPDRTAVLERTGALIQITEVDHAAVTVQEEPHATGGFDAMEAPVLSLLVPDVDKEVEQLAKAGVDILQMPQDDIEGTYRVAQIRDNDRHRIELREPIDEYGAFNPAGR